MHFLWVIVIGFVAGIIARFLAPGPNNPAGFILTTLLGIAGAFIATLIGQTLGLVPARSGGRPARCRGRRAHRSDRVASAGGQPRHPRSRTAALAVATARSRRPDFTAAPDGRLLPAGAAPCVRPRQRDGCRRGR